MIVEELKLEELETPRPSLQELTYDETPVQREVVKEKKSFWNKVFKKKKLEKNNTIAILFLRNNGVAEPMERSVRNGFINVEGKTYHENRDCIYRIKVDGHTYPLALIPEWSLIPIGTRKWDDKAMLEKFAELQDHTLKGIRHAELVKMEGRSGTKINAKAAIGIAIALVIVFAVAKQYLG